MKKLISTLLISAGLGITCSANAYIIQAGAFTGTDVGGLDLFLAETNGLPNSSTATETTWVNSVLEPDTTYVIKDEPVAYFATESANVFAFQLLSSPGYFLIKNAQWWGLFENTASADWGVVDFSAMNDGFNLPDLRKMTISHVTEFGDYEVTVPEPSSLLLALAGLLGLTWSRKYRNRTN